MLNEKFTFNKNGFLTEFWGDDINVVVPEGTKGIDTGAFFCCGNIETVYVPDSCNEICSGAFVGCSSLKYIKVPDDIKLGDKLFHFIEEENKKTKIYYRKPKNDDIVDRLRNKKSRDNRKLLDEAADEIEKLRKLLYNNSEN